MTRRVLFTGSRTYDNAPMVRVVLWGLAANAFGTPSGDVHIPVEVCHGGALGLDALIGREARQIQAAVLRAKSYPANWRSCDRVHPVVPCPPGDEHRRNRGAPFDYSNSYCPLAGLRRNQLMLDSFKPDLVVAFVDKPLASSRGTNDMVERAVKAGIDVHVITSEGRP